MGHEAKWEYFRVMYGRYSKAKGTGRSRLLDEFCVTTGYNRKYAIQLLNGVAPEEQRVKRARGRKPRYGKQVISILMTVWEAAGYPWSLRLKALLPRPGSVRRSARRTGGPSLGRAVKAPHSA